MIKNKQAEGLDGAVSLVKPLKSAAQDFLYFKTFLDDVFKR